MSLKSPPSGSITSVCRDCLSELTTIVAICEHCGSDRIICHSEMGQLSIAHIDCDAFYAAVEKRDNPALKDKPVLIGGGQRGVVSTACYIARRYGPHSAMPMYKALKLCPNAVVITPDMAKYTSVSEQVRQVFESTTPAVEPLSLDEAFLDLSGTSKLFGRSPAATLAYIALEIERKVRITVSIGLSYNKFLAKIASDLDKPRGFAVIGKKDAIEVLHDMPVSRLPGVGPALAGSLKVDGLHTIGDLQRQGKGTLGMNYGQTGEYLARLAHGIDRRPVRSDRNSKTVSAEITFPHDIGDATELRRRLWPLCERVAESLKAKGLSGRAITLKMKTTNFKIITRHSSLRVPTQLAETIFRVVEPMIAREIPGKSFRLIGVGVDMLSKTVLPDQGDLFADNIQSEETRYAKVERAMDAVRNKFGHSAIRKGRIET
ncbi:MAG TPA: DNA polymerase IV [Rhodospirillaceae bacterium]|nr:DNA polymerase IV [Candidatus Neomarinimicrobiota bacterium]HCX14126.1 DNA polymerase IV [Rhodospirillaceae bacterium]